VKRGLCGYVIIDMFHTERPMMCGIKDSSNSKGLDDGHTMRTRTRLPDFVATAKLNNIQIGTIDLDCLLSVSLAPLVA